MYIMTDFYISELIQIVPITHGGGLNEVYRVKDGVPNYNGFKTDIIYVCRIVKEIVAENKKYCRVIDSQKNSLIHYQIHDIKYTFHNIHDFENYINKEYKDGDIQYYSFKFK